MAYADGGFVCTCGPVRHYDRLADTIGQRAEQDPSEQLATPAAPPRLPGWFWRGVAGAAAALAILTLTLHHNAQFVAAGLLAAGTAVAAQAKARFRGQQGRSSDVADILTAALALATTLMYLLALAASTQPG